MKKCQIIILLTVILGSQPLLNAAPLSINDEASATVDSLVDKGLKENNLSALPAVSDEVFLRRIYLDIGGRIPSYQETLDFLKSGNKDKRTLLIDKLLNSDAYVSKAFNYWADILRIKTRVSGKVLGGPYITWLKDSLKENKAYDKMVVELLTAEGSSWEPNNGATGYFLRDTGMPEDNMSNTSRIFLGTQMACAQCHDHPFDKWTRKEFYEMLAFTSGVSLRSRKGAKDSKKLTMAELRKLRQAPQAVRVSARRLVLALEQGVYSNKSSVVKLPADYQYDDAKPFQTLSAHTLFGEDVTLKRNVDPRKAYAEWMTSAKNPRFTKVIANRMWKQVMGRGLIEPVDDIKDSTEASNPELMAFLEKEMIRQKFNLKSFLRMLYMSKSYQRQAYSKDFNLAKTYHFPGPIKHRLGAEQIWDSVLTIAFDNIDARQGPGDPQDEVYEYYKKYKTLSPSGALDLILEKSKEMSSVRAVGVELRKLSNDLKEARKNNDSKKMRELRSQLQKLRKKRQEAMEKSGGRKGQGKKGSFLVRASEGFSPSPPEHFLRLMGQSDRELIQGANLDPNVTQVLAFYNGFVDKVLLMGTTPLSKNLKAATTDDKRMDVMFLSILSRYPKVEERGWVKEHIGDSKGFAKTSAYKDIVWVLLNTHEFMFAK